MSRDAEARRARAGILFVTPALALIGVFFLLPVAASLLLSATDFDLYAVADVSRLRLVGLGNYAALAQDPLFWTALGNTFYFVVVASPLSVAVSLTAAVAVTAGGVRLAGLLRTLFFLPVVTSLVAVAVVWRYLYHPRFGLLNAALATLGIPPQDWLGNPHLAMPAIILLAVWKSFGFNMVVFMAGLQSIPTQLYEAASVDGAGKLAQFWRVTLPMLKPTFAFVIVISLIANFQLFAEPYVMTRGGPSNHTLSVVLYMYEQGFRWWSLGYAAAIAFVLFGVIVAVSLLTRCLARGRGAQA
ncbi:MAG: carbohydrate ABC transporter permease [Candidatus Binatia bacterium]